jgi:rhamnulokinase
VAPGTRLGAWNEAPQTPVFASAGHDTAAAVAAVPASAADWCYISSGTWSLMGLELDTPVINAQSLAMNVTNEIGVGGKVRLLKNIAGLWLLQECRRAWLEEGAEYSYEALARAAAEARPFPAIINPDAFLRPGQMPRQIADHCRATGQEPPRNAGEFARAILESLALRYRMVLEGLEKLTGSPIRVIHIVGGGSRNTVLNQFVADATRRTVVAGPAEATAIGNILVQAMGSGAVADLVEGRRIVRDSFPVTVVEPQPGADWDAAYARFTKLV